MNTHIRSILRATTLTTASFALLSLGSTAALAGQGGDAQVDVIGHCTSVDVSSTKDISNVVLLFADGDTQRFEDLRGRNGTFSGTGDNAGQLIETLWVKSGANHSDDGPGHGERFDLDTSGCETDPIDAQSQDDEIATSGGAKGATDSSADDQTGQDGGDDEADGERDQRGRQNDQDEDAADEAAPSTGTADEELNARADDREDDEDTSATDDTNDADDADTTGADVQAAAADDDDEDTPVSTDDDADARDEEDTPGTTGTAAAAADAANADTQDADAEDALVDDQQVLDANVGRVIAAGGDVISAAGLPVAGADTILSALGAMSSLLLGGALLKRTRTV